MPFQSSGFCRPCVKELDFVSEKKTKRSYNGLFKEFFENAWKQKIRPVRPSHTRY
jgi:hypothetical protein